MALVIYNRLLSATWPDQRKAPSGWVDKIHRGKELHNYTNYTHARNHTRTHTHTHTHTTKPNFEVNFHVEQVFAKIAVVRAFSSDLFKPFQSTEKDTWAVNWPMIKSSNIPQIPNHNVFFEAEARGQDK